MDNEQNSAADDAGPEGMQGPDHALLNRIDSILSSQALSAVAHVRKMRAKKPDLTPAAAIKKLNRQLLSASAAAGAAAGATGAAPGVTIRHFGKYPCPTVGPPLREFSCRSWKTAAKATAS